MPRIVRPGGRQHRLELDAAQTAKLTLSQLITAHTDAAAQPNPCPTHTQNISSSNLLSFQRKNIRGGGPRARTHFLLPLSPPFAAKCLIPLGLASVPLLDLGLLGIPTNWLRIGLLFASRLQ